MTSLMETAHTAPTVPAWVMGAIVLALLLGVIGWIVGMGSGRPHSR